MNNGYNQNQNAYDSYTRHIPNFVQPYVWQYEKRNIKRLSIFAAIAILGFIGLSQVFAVATQVFLQFINEVSNSSADFETVWASAEFMYLFQTLYSIIGVGIPFFVVGLFINKTDLRAPLPMGKPLDAKYLPLIVLGAFGVCLTGNIITSYIDIIFESFTGMGLEMPELASTPKSVTGVILSFLSTAVVPALIEEIALRGIIMQPLRRYGDWFAILASSLIFGLMHCNLLQIPFAFIAGIAIGYAVIVTESVWTGVIIHFFNNAFAVALTILSDFYGMESKPVMAANIVFYVLIGIGLACAFFYVKKLQKRPLKHSPLVNKGSKFMGTAPYPSAQISNSTVFGTYILTIPMIVAFIVVAIETVTMLLLY